MKYYQPGMMIEKIEGFSLTDDEYQMDHLTGLRMHMRGSSSSKTMSLIGTNLEPDNMSEVLRYGMLGAGYYDQPYGITILYDEIGVCDVIIKRGDGTEESLSKDNFDCQAEFDSITSKSYDLPRETPLVGFHGIAYEEGLESLGLILLDSLDPVCRVPLKES